jgi:hypothetical protein
VGDVAELGGEVGVDVENVHKKDMVTEGDHARLNDIV